MSRARLDSADTGAFTVASVSGYVLTLTQSESFVLTPETSPNVTVGNGMIGVANTSISLSDVPLFSATTANGSIYLEPGAGVNSTAVNVNAGGMYGMANNVSVTSQASFLTIERITATGTAQAAMNHGALLEYPSLSYTGLVASFAPTQNDSATGNDYYLTGGNWSADGFAPGDLITLTNFPGVQSTTKYVVASIGSDILGIAELFLLAGETIPLTLGEATVAVPGDIIGEDVSLSSPYSIGTASSPFLTNAASGLTVAATATSPSSAGIYVDNDDPLRSVGVSTYDGDATILSGYNGGSYSYVNSLSFQNSVLSETGVASVSFTNTDISGGSDDDVIISGPVYVDAISVGIGLDGTTGAGQILEVANSNASVEGVGGTVTLSAAVASAFRELPSTPRTSRHWMRRRWRAASMSIIPPSSR